MRALPAYAELHCRSNFSFLYGASHPEELVQRASELGYAALAVTDECSLAGVVRAHEAARATSLKLLIGSQFCLEDGGRIVVLAMNREGYGNLAELITLARRRAEKGTYILHAADLDSAPDAPHLAGLPDCLVLWVPDEHDEHDKQDGDAALQARADWLARTFAGRCWLAVEWLQRQNDDRLLERLRRIAQVSGVPLVAAGDVVMHVRSRKPLQDTLTAIRLSKPVAECGLALQANAEQHLRTRLRLAQLLPPELLAETINVAERCHFSLDELRYEYPEEIVPPGETHAGYLRRMVFEGTDLRYPQGVPQQVMHQIEHELALITELRYEAYFLTVFDVVRFARTRGILCQGRGSAANSAVCYCLSITEVDPARANLLFERFISRERNEPPDIDVDFEHQRREEVIQYIYQRYGRARAALAATVITYRPRSAMRDIGRALGLDRQRLDLLVASHAWWDGRHVHPERLAENGFDPDSPVIRKLAGLMEVLLGFPRHLSQHVGGFVIARDSLARLVPIENAAMAERSVIQWDKDDLQALGLMKVDILALGMLSAIRRALDLISMRCGQPFRMQDIPPEDAATFDSICAADTVGVFQIESRAQMSMLPRLRPRCFYDLVIEVAIVRPGPIQGGMVHPYLRRRQGLEDVDYPGPEVRQALERTLGIPLFQEQVMQVAVLAAGFTPGEADQLRRSMAAWRRKGGVQKFRERMLSGMRERGYADEFAERIFRQIEGFGEYGFPESHAASFALLVYVSAWIKRHEPEAFLCAMLNSQPLGFYTASQLVQDAQRHGVTVCAVDVQMSAWECTLENRSTSTAARPAVRLGLNRVKGLGEEAGRRIACAREAGPFSAITDLARRSLLSARELNALANADALRAIAGHRHAARWSAAALRDQPAPASRQQTAAGELLQGIAPDEDDVILPVAKEGHEILADYGALGLTLRRHPLALLRPRLEQMRLATARQLRELANGRLVRTSGLVTMRQRPGTAGGTVFVTLEDETGTINVICWKDLVERQRRALLGARLLTVYGTWQREGEVMHLVAGHLIDHSYLLGRLVIESRDFH